MRIWRHWSGSLRRLDSSRFSFKPFTESLFKVTNVFTQCQVLLNTEPGTNFGHGARVAEEALFKASMKTSLAYCKGLGARYLHIMAGRVQEGVTRHQAMETFRNNIR